MQQTFFFYDLETSGTDPRNDRIMQFAGQRTTLELEPIGDPINLLVKMTDDTLPSPYAIEVTGITPQSTQADGLTEAELCRYLTEEVFTPGTISLGYNTIRFDDEFIRYLLWRNFYDPYEWQWKDGRGRWDMLDVVRMTRALRPEGIKWPTLENGKITNKLDMLTVANGIEHTNAHDAMADVNATIAVARLIKTKQPELFRYLFKIRTKTEVQRRVNLDNKQPFVYSCGRYGTKHNFTTVAFPLTTGRNGNVQVFDLRYDLESLLEETNGAAAGHPQSLRGRSDEPREDGREERPAGALFASPNFYPKVKELQYNRCPAVAPLGVLKTEADWQKIDLDPETVQHNQKILLEHPEFAEQMRSACEQGKEWPKSVDPESALYDGFLLNADRVRCDAVHNAKVDQLADFNPEFVDERLPDLLVHYKARNYPRSLNASEADTWEQYRHQRLERQKQPFMDAVEKLQGKLSPELIEELVAWYHTCLSSD